MVEWNDVNDSDLIGELEERGYYVISDRNDYSVIEELESRGYYVTKEKMNQVSQDDVFNLYQIGTAAIESAVSLTKKLWKLKGSPALLPAEKECVFARLLLLVIIKAKWEWV